VAGHNERQQVNTEASVTYVAAADGTSKKAAWCWMLVGVIALVAPAMIVYSLWWAPEPITAMYQRDAAPRAACKAAAVAMSALRPMAGLTLVDDCDAPTVTEVLNDPGLFIVTLDVEEQGDGLRGRRRTYSVMIDGRAFDKWRILDVKLAPNSLTLDASQLTSALSASLGTQDAFSAANPAYR
jgi:hypothetical protein